MHELGIVVHISKTLEELAQENNITPELFMKR